MKWTDAFIPTLREDPQEAEVISHKLMIRAALIRKLTAGAYSYLPLGHKVLSKIQNIIREEMANAGAMEVLLPALQPLELWKKTGRDKDLGEVMIKFRDRHGKIVCLGPTHEEVITELVSKEISSYRDLPKILFQIQTKFRDELRPRFGVLRSCEFIMKDAYSFDAKESDLETSYKKMYDAYKKIFSKCGLAFIIVEADSGIMGGGTSHEFMVPAGSGEDIVVICDSCGYKASKDVFKGKEVKNGEPCPKCKKGMKLQNAIEIGHTFKLGTKYSKALNARYLDKYGAERDIIMGCYGIGVNRIMASLIETSNDKDGIIWPFSIAPYEVAILPVDMRNAKLKKTADDIYEKLLEKKIDIILDDRDISAGVKFKDADLVGIPLQIIIGEKNLKNEEIELKFRKNNKIEKIKAKDAIKKIESLLKDNPKESP